MNTKCIVVGDNMILQNLKKIEGLMISIIDDKTAPEEMIFEFKNSRSDLILPEVLVEKKKKPHHTKRQKGWER